MLSYSLENFKSFGSRQKILLKPITLIYGANSSGKSSFMQPFMILKQTIENNSDSEALIINGENANLTESQQIFCKNNRNNKSFSIYWEQLNQKKEINNHE